MKLEDIRDPSLRQWVTDYTVEKAAERRAQRRSSDDLRSRWATYTEGDWAALRELLGLRERAVMAQLEQGVIDHAIAKRIDGLPRIERNGVSYRAPYSLGLEVAVLRELLGERAPRPAPKPRAEVEQLDFTEPDRPEEPHSHRGR